MVKVQVAGSDPLDGFDIQIKTDSTVLKAADASLTGSIIGADANVLVKCFDGVLVAGSVCSSTDANGVLHFAAVKIGPNVAGSGLLFTAVYNVVSKTPNIALSLLSVTVSNGTLTPNSETTRGAFFSNLTDFSITANPTSISTPPSVAGTSIITLTSFGGFTDFLTITVTSSSVLLTASTVDAGLFLAPDGTASTTLSVSSATQGSYSVDVTGTGSNPAFTHKVTVPVTVTPASFSLTAAPASLSLAPGNSDTSTITVSSIAKFTGTVALTASAPGLTAALSPSSVVLGTTATSTLTVTAAAGTTPGSYTVTVTGTSGTISKSVTVAVTVGVPDFSFSAVPDTITVFRIGPFTTAANTLNLASINNFAATLSLTATISFSFVSTPGSSSLPFTLDPSVTLAAGGTASAALVATVTKSTAGTGLYFATITAVGGGKTHTATLSIWVIDFLITPRDATIKMINQPGSFGQDPLSIAPIGAPNRIGPSPPLNATDGFNINPGLTSGVASFPLDYYTNSRSGLKFNATLGLDRSATSTRCFLAVFDSAGNLIRPVVSKGLVQSFAGPIVHLNGDQFGFGPTNNGCRLDSLWYVDPLNGNTNGDVNETSLVTVEPIKTTPNGTFTTLVCLQAGGLINCVTITIIMVAPPIAPALTVFSGQSESLSLNVSRGIATFTVGVINFDPTTAIYQQVTISAVSSDGSIAIVGVTGIIFMPALDDNSGFSITFDFSKVPAGTRLSINVAISYGVAPNYLTLTSFKLFDDAAESKGSIIIVR